MALENVELVQECSPEHLRMRTVRLTYEKEKRKGTRLLL